MLSKLNNHLNKRTNLCFFLLVESDKYEMVLENNLMHKVIENKEQEMYLNMKTI